MNQTFPVKSTVSSVDTPIECNVSYVVLWGMYLRWILGHQNNGIIELIIEIIIEQVVICHIRKDTRRRSCSCMFPRWTHQTSSSPWKRTNWDCLFKMFLSFTVDLLPVSWSVGFNSESSAILLYDDRWVCVLSERYVFQSILYLPRWLIWHDWTVFLLISAEARMVLKWKAEKVSKKLIEGVFQLHRMIYFLLGSFLVYLDLE